MDCGGKATWCYQWWQCYEVDIFGKVTIVVDGILIDMFVLEG